MRGLVDVSEDAAYGWRFFPRHRALGRPPALALPYFNVVFWKR